MVLTPPFGISPAYFILQNNEEIKFQSLFFPSTYGVQVFRRRIFFEIVSK